jgi:hypothetical protein
MIVQEANTEFLKAMVEIEVKYELTYGELVGIAAEYLAGLAKYMRREERHPENPDKKGDEA